MAEPEKPKVHSPGCRLGWGQRIRLFVLLFAVASSCSLASLYVYHRNYSLHFAAFDMGGFIRDIRDGLQTNTLDKPAIEARFDQLDRLLDSVPANTVILASGVVIRPRVEVPDRLPGPHLVFLTPRDPTHVFMPHP